MDSLLPINAPDFHRVEFNGEPVLTTEQLAKAFGVTVDVIKMNFSRNRDRYVAGKHFYLITGEALNDLRVTNSYLQISPMTRGLYLWTKRGCARHCKSIGTDVAWDVFEVLEENYFRPKIAEHLQPGAPFDFERGQALAKLVPHCKDAKIKLRLIAKAANLILGEEFITVPEDDKTVQLSLFYH